MAIDPKLLEGIELMKEGKEEGFNIFYSYTYPFVYSRARLVMENEEDALDLTQETFLQAYKSIASLKDPSAVYAWLRTLTYNHGMRIFRKREHETLLSEDGEFIFEEMVSPDLDSRPEDATDAKETVNIVKGMLDELPAEQRSSLVAFYYDGLKITEIAELYGVSENTIKSRLRYAKEALKEKVTLHEKQNRYKLCSLSPAVLFMASEALLGSGKYILSTTGAKSVYATVCGALGFTPTVLASGVAVTSGATMAASAGSAASGAAAAGVAAKGGLTLAAKIAIAAVATTGVIAGIALLPKADKKPYADEMTALIQKVEERLEVQNLLETNKFDIEASVLGAFVETEDTTALATAEEIIAEIITPEMSEFEKVKAIHDYIVMNFDYDYENVQADTIPATSYTAEGVLSTSRGVSAGYAKTFELLCKCAGIETDYIVGTTKDGLQIWNQVKVDEQWYNIDVSMDDPFEEGKAFDFHLNNHYSYFLLSDSDVLFGQGSAVGYYALNQEYTCNANSVGNKAFDYYCPWLENNPDINYATTEEEVETIMLKALADKVPEFTLFLRNDQYDQSDLNYFVNRNSALGGYQWSKMSWTDWNEYANEFFTNWTFTVDLTQEQWPILSSEEEVKEFIKMNDSKLTYEGTSVYYTSDSFDIEAINEWAFYNGYRAMAGGIGYEVTEGRYTSGICFRDNDRNILFSLEEIEAAIWDAYTSGEEFYSIAYSFYETDITRQEAMDALEEIIPYEIIYRMGYPHAYFDYLVERTLYFKR